MKLTKQMILSTHLYLPLITFWCEEGEPDIYNFLKICVESHESKKIYWGMLLFVSFCSPKELSYVRDLVGRINDPLLDVFIVRYDNDDYRHALFNAIEYAHYLDIKDITSIAKNLLVKIK